MINWCGEGIAFTAVYAVIVMCALIIVLAFSLKGADRK